MVLYIDSQETDKAILCATEYVEPLSIHLNREIEHQEQYLSWGILQVFRGVAFLHEAHLIHGSLHAGSVFVTLGGEWKLFGFEQMRSTQGPNNDYSKRHWPAMSKYSPPEVQKNSSMDLTEAQVCIVCILYTVGELKDLTKHLFME